MPIHARLLVIVSRGPVMGVELRYLRELGLSRRQPTLAKRLERERFCWPRSDEPVVRLTGQELNWLLDGYDVMKMKPHESLVFSSVL